MNWPPLTQGSSQAIAEVLRDAVAEKPKDLFEYVAQRLQERSGQDPVAFEDYFQECKRKVRTYVLEEECPAEQDPLSWVPMRYNDDTILLTLQQKAQEIVGEILNDDLIDDTKGLVKSVGLAYPELAYLRGSPEEVVASQVVRAIYLGSSGCPSVLEHGLDDADPLYSFRCKALIECARGQFFEPALWSDDSLDPLIVCCLLRVLGTHEGFKRRFGGGLSTSEAVVMHAIENEPLSLPSFHRLAPAYKQAVLAALQTYIPLEMLVSVEAVPAHFAKAKELLMPKEGGIPLFLAVIAVEHILKYRTQLVSDDMVDLVRLSTQCFAAVEKYSAARAYELLLKKRAERHGWRLVRDDLIHRAIIRLCCFAGFEDNDSWGAMLMAVESLPESEQDVLKTELGRKDGLSEAPVYVLSGAATIMALACGNPEVTMKPAVRLLARILEDVAATFDRSLNRKVLTLHLEGLAGYTRDFRAEGEEFQEVAFTLKEVGPGEVVVTLA